MFLGFRLDEWDFRVLYRSLHELRGRSGVGEYTHVAVQIDPRRARRSTPGAPGVPREYFSSARVSVYWGSTDHFVKELRTPGGSDDDRHRRAPRVGNPYVGPRPSARRAAVRTRPRTGGPGRPARRRADRPALLAVRVPGKTSLIQAALIPALRDGGFEVLPVIRVKHALEPRARDARAPQPLRAERLLSLEEGGAAGEQRPVAELATLTLREYLDAHADRDGRPGNEVLIFDQFEEVLTADPTDEEAKREFFRQLGDALRDRPLGAVLHAGGLPGRAGSLPRSSPRGSGRPSGWTCSPGPQASAIRSPAERVGVEFTEEAAKRLVATCGWSVCSGRRIPRTLGPDVEPVQLQVVCHHSGRASAGATHITPPTSSSTAGVDGAGRLLRRQGRGRGEADRCPRAGDPRTGSRKA